jgi:deazaflavin-dependent oxidoreductase (nitroreductase family)
VESSDIQKALDSSAELQITVTGRKSGREFSTPVWFVREGKTVFLMPVRGSKNQWYKNVLKSRRIKISSGKVSLELVAKPIDESKRVASIADKFRKKHGAADVKRYYTRFDAAVELDLP